MKKLNLITMLLAVVWINNFNCEIIDPTDDETNSTTDDGFTDTTSSNDTTTNDNNSNTTSKRCRTYLTKYETSVSYTCNFANNIYECISNSDETTYLDVGVDTDLGVYSRNIESYNIKYYYDSVSDFVDDMATPGKRTHNGQDYILSYWDRVYSNYLLYSELSGSIQIIERYTYDSQKRITALEYEIYASDGILKDYYDVVYTAWDSSGREITGKKSTPICNDLDVSLIYSGNDITTDVSIGPSTTGTCDGKEHNSTSNYNYGIAGEISNIVTDSICVNDNGNVVP